MSRSIALLGSTGSIGESTLQVVRHHTDRLRVEALAAQGRKLERLEEQIQELHPRLVAVHDTTKAAELRKRVGGEIEVVSGREGLLQAARLDRVDPVVVAVVGAAGLPATHAALEAGKDVALANTVPRAAAVEPLRWHRPGLRRPATIYSRVAPAAMPGGASSSIRRRVSVSRRTLAARAFSSTLSGLRVHGIGTTSGPWCRS